MAIKMVQDQELEKEENRILPFSYDSVTERDREVVEEVLRELNLQDSLLSEKVREKFEFTPTTEVPYENSIFYQLCKQNEIYISPQGFIKEGNVKYPLLSICADIRELDKLVMDIAKKYGKSDT